MKLLYGFFMVITIADGQSAPDTVEQQAILNRIRETAQRYQK